METKAIPTGEDLELLAVQNLLATKGSAVIDPNGNSLLAWASRNGNLKVVRLLIEKYQLPLNVQNFDGETALSAAVLAGNCDIVKLLIERGADLNIANIRCESPLHQAAVLGNSEIVRAIVEEGGYLDAEDECGDTPLHFAVREDKAQVVEYLLSVGADPDHLNQDEESPAEFAEAVGSSEVRNAFRVHNERSSMVICASLDTSFGINSLLLQKSANTKKSIKIPNATDSTSSSSLALSNSRNDVWQGENSTSSFPKRLTPNSNLPGGYLMGRQLINV